MKLISQTDNSFMLRFDPGEEALHNLINFCKDSNIKNAWFTAIGATKNVVLSYYNLETKAYEDHPIIENLEVVSMTGNVGILNGEFIVHSHGVFSNTDLETIGGHIKSLVVSATLEVHLTKQPGELQRTFDKPTGLNLMQ